MDSIVLDKRNADGKIPSTETLCNSNLSNIEIKTILKNNFRQTNSAFDRCNKKDRDSLPDPKVIQTIIDDVNLEYF